MHLLVAQPGVISDGSEALDLGQSPGSIIYISAADTELACLSQAVKIIDTVDVNFPSLRLANLMQLGHNMSVDIYVEKIIEKAKIVIVRILGGRSYWSYGIDEISSACINRNIPLGLLSGDDQPDIELTNLSTINSENLHKIWQYQVHGGINNAKQMLFFVASLIGFKQEWQEPKLLVRAGLYWPKKSLPDITFLESEWVEDAPIVGLVFYRALIQAGNTSVVDALIKELIDIGLNPLPIFTQSLKDAATIGVLEAIFSRVEPDIILNATGFSVSSPGAARKVTPFELGRKSEPPIVIQIVFSGGNYETWKNQTNGLSARDIAMNVALPEVDGRVFSRAVSFKSSDKRDDRTECNIVCYEPASYQIKFVCELTLAWINLRRTPRSERQIALLLANYPNRDGRIGNGVGLDTPEGTIQILNSMLKAGYNVHNIPADGLDLVKRLLAGPTNNFLDLENRVFNETLSISEYKEFFCHLPQKIQKEILERWGKPENDPFYQTEDLGQGYFVIQAYRLGNVTIGLQPARGYNIDPKETYHSPDLVPPHNYLAFYAWLRYTVRVHAIVHVGKHGNLEWLPGKALALSEECYPEVAFGPIPNLYPFIINDPGEGTQAKRRTAAVIIDHMTPPLTRAESYGHLRDLEQLVDEYFEASGIDPRRLDVLKRDILDLCQTTGIDKDCGFGDGDDENQLLEKLDNYLCELKELQIKDGLHIFGTAPKGRLLNDLLVSLTRVPRNQGLNRDASLIRSLAKDLNLQFDPLNCNLGEFWKGNRPECLAVLSDSVWRTAGDTVERLELLASSLVSGQSKIKDEWKTTEPVFNYLQYELRSIVKKCGSCEISGLLKGLDGIFVESGPSGAPTRGRVDVLPTGRNFYSVDTRTIPTPAAWTLGWKSAVLLIERHMQDHGSWPKNIAISAWGTSNMRTGGDDIAQALAFLGVKPTWDPTSRRVVGFDIIPAKVLGRPRVDVTLRISGFFRDAFPALIELFDSAVRAVADLNESEEDNPIAFQISDDIKLLASQGIGLKEAERRAGCRVFGSKPGAYGAGLQALIDEKGWSNSRDLAKAYIAWGGYAYGAGSDGLPEHSLFEQRLKGVEVVIQNQDNREHDLLDSDDYYQFEGGISAAVKYLSGTQPVMYHNDHSRPEFPRINTLQDEIARIVRARAVNPKWISGVMRHGYKGAFEIAATVDYLFAFAVTAACVGDHHFDAMFDAYLVNDEVREFLELNNPAALREIAMRFMEAEERGVWKTRRNDTVPLLKSIIENKKLPDRVN